MSEPIKQFMAHTDLLRRSMEKHGKDAMMQGELMDIIAADRIAELEDRLTVEHECNRCHQYHGKAPCDDVAELEAALREIVQHAKPKYRSTRDKDVRAGICLSGELLHYEIMPHLIHAGMKALEKPE